jgi:uncharacterized protein
MMKLLIFLVLILLSQASPLRAVTSDGNCLTDKRTLDLDATGFVNVKPDVAYISFNTEAKNAKAQVAYAEHTKKMSSILDAIKGVSIEAKDIRTRGMSLQPQYSYSNREGKQIFEHYFVQQQLMVTIRDVEKVSSVLDAAVTSGALLRDVNFTVEDSEAAATEASKKAYDLIKSKAAAIALSLGVELGKPIRVNDDKGSSFHPKHAMMRGAAMEMMDDGGGGSHVESGEVRLSHTVSITYEIM